MRICSLRWRCQTISPTLLMCTLGIRDARAQLVSVFVVVLCGTRWVSFSVQSILSRELPLRHRQLPEKEDDMSKDRNLQFCMDQLKSMQSRDGLEPEQMSALERAEGEMKRLWRKPNPNRREIFKVVRKVAEAIIKTFVD